MEEVRRALAKLLTLENMIRYGAMSNKEICEKINEIRNILQKKKN
jgi:ribosomal protein L29